MANKQILKLDMGAVQDGFFSDTAMIGIVCSLPAHKFCWTINNLLDFEFVRDPDSDVEYAPSKEEKHFFSMYQYCESVSSCEHLLYKLKSHKKSLLPEIKQLDYLWLIKSQDAELQCEIIADQLKSLPDVQLAQIIAPERLKNLNHLLL